MDMWDPYRLGIAEEFPDTRLSFDRSHLMAPLFHLATCVRRNEVRSMTFLKKCWGMLTAAQASDLDWLMRMNS